jgi:hypothetical protein
LKHENTDYPVVEIRHDTVHITLSLNGYATNGGTRQTPEFIEHMGELCTDKFTLEDAKKVVLIKSTLPIQFTMQEFRDFRLALDEGMSKLYLVRLQSRMKAKGEAKKFIVCYCCYGSQPDIQLLCDQSWTTPSYDASNETPIIPNVYKAANERYYSFEKHNVTCEACLKAIEGIKS